MLEDTELCFENGRPDLQFVGGLGTDEKIAAAWKEILTDDALNRRFKDLMVRKWEEWLARETDRGLDG